MRRLLAWLVVLSVLLVPALAMAETPIRLVVDGAEVQTDVAPVIEEGRTLVPLRAVTEALRFEVSWDGPSQTATLTKGKTTIMLIVDKSDALVNGEPVKLDVPPTIRSDRMLVPVRFVAETVGLEVAWDEANRTVVITSNEPVVDPAALALLQQVKEGGSRRITGDLDITVATVLGPMVMEMSTEAYEAGPEESLFYNTVRVEGEEQTMGSAVHQGQFWIQDETRTWAAMSLEEIGVADPLSNPTSLANLNPEDLMGASVTLSQQAYEGIEMQVVTLSVDVAALNDFLGGQDMILTEGRFEVNYWFNADNTLHHTDFFLEAATNDLGVLGMTMTGTLYFEPWDQPIPFPAEITGAGE